MNTIVIFGATSKIAHQVARHYAADNAQFYLIGRDGNKLELVRDDLKARGASSVITEVLDISDFQDHSACLNRIVEAFSTIDLCLVAHGTLGDQSAAEQDIDEALLQITTNGTSFVSLMTLVGNQLESQGRGTLAVISSVAGDRGRQSNYVYGSAKALVSTFAQGMAHRFANSPVNVVLIKPGFVDTPMTAEFDKGLLWASPDSVAKGIVNAIAKGSSQKYLPFFWQQIMLIIKFVPTWIMHKTKL